MQTEKRALFGVLVMLVFLLAGVVGTVSAAAAEQTAQLRLEVRLLQRINELNLTNEQIDMLLPVLKSVQSIMQKSEADLEILLAKEKELLLQRKTKEAEALQVEKKVIREKAALQVKTALVDLQKILTPEQLKKIRGGLPVSGVLQNFTIRPVTGKKDEAYLHGTGTGQIKLESSGSVVVVQKADQQGKDAPIERSVTIKLPVEQARAILKNREEHLTVLEAQLAKAKEQEKNILSRQIEQLKEGIAELKDEIAKSIDGTVVIGPKVMGQEVMRGTRLSVGKMNGVVRKEVRGGVMVSRPGKGPGGQLRIRIKDDFALGKKSEVLATLIKVLEEMRQAR